MQPTLFCRFLLFLTLTCALCALAAAQRKSGNIWTEVSVPTIEKRSVDGLAPSASFRVYRLDKAALQTVLVTTPEEFSAVARFAPVILELPMPDGSFSRFRVERSLVVEPGLAEKYPELAQTYRGQGIDDPTATVRFDLLSNGFHSMILSPKGNVFVDPYSGSDTDTYISYYKRDVLDRPAFSCGTDGSNTTTSPLLKKKDSFRDFVPEAVSPAVSSGNTLRQYRLALAATGEYTAVTGGTVASALAAQVTVMNRVDAVYERELATRMVIIANNDSLIYTNAATDPYTNDDGGTMIDQNPANIDSVIGSANYDIGHVFSTGGGGIASIGVVCRTSKARGVTGLPSPFGDPFAIDFVAHEMGHQFGAQHTFNGLDVGFGGFALCNLGQRAAGSAYEPGSGITIMAYAGTCTNQDLAAHSIDTFHAKSLEEIIAYSQSGQGNTCALSAASGNTPPNVAVVGGPTFNIPRLTPFVLTASANDVNGDTITYDWQEYDLGGATNATPNSDSDAPRPIFRVYPPTASPSRTFPSMQFVVNNGNTPPTTTNGFLTGEILPAIGRTMSFQVVARDNRAGGGGINTATASVVVDGASGPFTVTNPNTADTWFAGQTKTITWDVNNTNINPVNVANVKISLSTDGGQSFPTVIAASTPNDGSFDFTMPSLNTTQGRIKIEAVGNIFFDISNVNFTISPSAQTSGFIAGRVTTAGGIGISRVYVVLSSPAGTQVALTNGFGFYRFESLAFGQNYTLAPIPRKGITFSPASTVISLNSDLTNANFTGQSN